MFKRLVIAAVVYNDRVSGLKVFKNPSKMELKAFCDKAVEDFKYR